MTAFDRAWDFMKGEGDHLYYNVRVAPRTDAEAWALREFEMQLSSEGISYDSGGMMGAGGGRDIHLDFSLKGATPDQVLQRLEATGIPYELEMIGSDIPPRGTNERLDYDIEEMKRYDEYMTQETGRRYMDGKPYSDAQGIGEHPCWQCAQHDGEHTMAVVVREGVQDNHRLTLNCHVCGLFDMDWGEENPGLAAFFEQRWRDEGGDCGCGDGGACIQ